MSSILEPIAKLRRDLRNTAETLSEKEARYLVDLYYQVQDYRMSAANQVRSSVPKDEPHELLRWGFESFETIEKGVRAALGDFALSRRAGRWALSIHGIGPVIAAGLLAHIEIDRAPTVGHIWRFAGLDPTLKWARGEKRPFNADLKVLCWKIGQSFMKLRGSDNDIYGKVYETRKAYEIERDLRGHNKGRTVRKAGKTHTVENLPPFIIDAQARRYAVKLFLSHLHHVMYECSFNAPPPKPYILSQPNHVHFIAPPQWPCE